MLLNKHRSISGPPADSSWRHRVDRTCRRGNALHCTRLMLPERHSISVLTTNVESHAGCSIVVRISLDHRHQTKVLYPSSPRCPRWIWTRST
ncbi:hypothetical protein NAS2_1448 [Conexivisphaera calida]|uniref:Uncharacterized protein n=1 Tax=Conexivisphaera calida TaxID=1874277 RepID=A0A4P2VHE6_9ARCH|nr:hypothetical protein NAS2_1448 [Conexivisphaera calida]